MRPGLAFIIATLLVVAPRPCLAAPTAFDQLWHDVEAARGTPSSAAAAGALVDASHLRQDYLLLKRVMGELDAADAALQTCFTEVEGLPVLNPAQDDGVRSAWGRHLRSRRALMSLMERYLRPFESRSAEDALPGVTLEQKRALMGYSSALLLFSSTVRLVERLQTPRSTLWKKLDEGDSSYDLQAGELSRFHRVITDRTNIRLLAEARRAYLESYGDDLLAERASHWLHERIRLDHAYVDAHAPRLWRSKLQQLWRAVATSVYRPYYAIQSAVAIWLGDTKYVHRAPAIGDDRIREMTALLEPGDILLERENWFLSNAFLPGFWPHGILYVGTVEDLERLGLTTDPRVLPHLADYASPDAHGNTRRVIEAVSEGVLMSPMEEATDADYICAFRPRVSPDAKREAIARAFSHVGKAYDFAFDFATSDELVCTEVLYRSYGDVLHFDMRKIMGRYALPAIDIVAKFRRELASPSQELDFVFFLDSDSRTGATWFDDAAALVATLDRPGLAFLLKRPDGEASASSSSAE